jgi:hypothetical protein
MRSATLSVLFVLLGAAVAVNGCSSSSNGTGAGGNGGGMAGKTGTAGTSAAGTGGGAAGTGGGAAGTGGGAGKAGAGGAAGGSGGAAGGSAGSTGAGGAQACGTDPASETGAGCNTIATGGPCVTQLIVSGPAPTAAGGTITAGTAGTYNLTSVSLYNTPDGSAPVASMGRRTLVISGVSGTSFTLDQVETSGARTDRSHGTVAIAGTTATFTPTCPPPSDAGDNGGSVGFTITATTITLINSPKGDGSVEVDVYTKA